MSYWLAQLVLAARRSNDRDTGWMQILVFVAVAVFYALGSIFKSRAGKTAPKGKEQPPGKPVRKPPELTIDLKMLKQLFGLPEEEPESDTQPQVTKPQAAKPSAFSKTSPLGGQVQPTRRKVVRPRPAVRKLPVETSQAAIPRIQSKLEKVPGFTGKAEVPAEIPQAEYLTDILSDYEDPEKLRRAILHYEILGKPISLREPSEQTIGF